MGDDPDSSVVDRRGVSHEVPIWALTWRTADHLVENWKSIAA
jgi:hypothetical protein